MFDIAKTRTTAFHPRSDGMVERLNRTIKDMLSKYINVKQTEWDDYIDCVVMAYNSSVHETTGITPFRMMFGSEMTIPVDLQTESLEIGKGEKISETKYVKNLCKNLELVHKFARERELREQCADKRDIMIKQLCGKLITKVILYGYFSPNKLLAQNLN